jgi:DNA-binding NarL/FixJ family response regulator
LPVAQPVEAPPESGRSSNDAPRFTTRQLDVLRLLAEGHSNKEIARTLDLGPGTVKIHLAAIFRTLHAHNRTEAVVLAAKLKL